MNDPTISDSSSRLARRVWVLILLLIATLIAARALHYRESVSPPAEPATKARMEPPLPAASGTTLELRAKLESPFDSLHFPSVDLPLALDWIQDQLDVTFLYQIDPAEMGKMRINRRNACLREVLCDLFARRDLAFILQRDAVVIIPAHRALTISMGDGQRLLRHSFEAEILCLVNEPVEVFCGDRGQYRIRILALEMKKGASGGEARPFVAHFSLYHNDKLVAWEAQQTQNEKWTTATFPSLPGTSLGLKLTSEDGVDLSVTTRFDYEERQALKEDDAARLEE